MKNKLLKLESEKSGQKNLIRKPKRNIGIFAKII